MLASYIPSQPVPGLGRVSGTAWSVTDLALGAPAAAAQASLLQPCFLLQGGRLAAMRCAALPTGGSPAPAAPVVLAHAGLVLMASNFLAGRLNDFTATQLGLGNVGCFLGGAAGCVAAMAALALFSTFGDLGRDDLLSQRGGGSGGSPPAAAS